MDKKSLAPSPAQRKKWYEDHKNDKDRWVKYRLKSKYGLTPEQFAALLAAQDFKCAICMTDDPGSRGRFFVDHCHDTKEVRGLLCHQCNTALGLLKDNTASLARAIEYLECKRT